MSNTGFISYISKMRDRAKADIELFNQFKVSVTAGSATDDGRLLEHLEGTVTSCDDLIGKANGEALRNESVSE
jgi:hypothetical protein